MNPPYFSAPSGWASEQAQIAFEHFALQLLAKTAMTGVAGSSSVSSQGSHSGICDAHHGHPSRCLDACLVASSGNIVLLLSLPVRAAFSAFCKPLFVCATKEEWYLAAALPALSEMPFNLRARPGVSLLRHVVQVLVDQFGKCGRVMLGMEKIKRNCMWVFAVLLLQYKWVYNGTWRADRLKTGCFDTKYMGEKQIVVGAAAFYLILTAWSVKALLEKARAVRLFERMLKGVENVGSSPRGSRARVDHSTSAGGLWEGPVVVQVR